MKSSDLTKDGSKQRAANLSKSGGGVPLNKQPKIIGPYVNEFVVIFSKWARWLAEGLVARCSKALIFKLGSL